MVIKSKYRSTCGKCGKIILRGTSIEWTKGQPAVHVNCATTDNSVNDYAGDGLDARWEDDFAARCGL